MKATTQSKHSLNSDQIARAAYGLWEQAGRPSGRDQEFWFKAEQHLTDIAKPAAVSIRQSQPKVSPDTSTTELDLGSQPKANSTSGKTSTIAVTQLAMARQKRTTVVARAG